MVWGFKAALLGDHGLDQVATSHLDVMSLTSRVPRTSTAFATATDDGAGPPISCNADGAKQELREVAELRADGEAAQGRTDGPAGQTLDVMLQPPTKVKRTQDDIPATGPFAGMKNQVLSQDPWKVERRWQVPRETFAEVAARHRRRGQAGTGPALPTSKELIDAGPFPLDKRMAALAAHAYYLNGEAKFVRRLAAGTPAEKAAIYLERFTLQADKDARALLSEADIPVSPIAPHLAVTVSSMSPMLAAALGSSFL